MSEFQSLISDTIKSSTYVRTSLIDTYSLPGSVLGGTSKDVAARSRTECAKCCSNLDILNNCVGFTFSDGECVLKA